jgi:hypothetical protein
MDYNKFIDAHVTRYCIHYSFEDYYRTKKAAKVKGSLTERGTGKTIPSPNKTPRRIAPLCSSASQLLWQGQTSHARTSSATAPHLPDADHPSHATLTARHETSQLPMRSLCT